MHDPPRESAQRNRAKIGMSFDIAVLGAREFGKAMMKMHG